MSHRIQSNAQCSDIPENDLIVTGYNRLNPLGGSGLGRVIYVFRARESVSYRLKLLNLISMTNAFAKRRTIAEQQCFELVQNDERLKPLMSRAGGSEIGSDLLLNVSRTVFYREGCRIFSTGPLTRKCIIINESCSDCPGVLCEMAINLALHYLPIRNPASLATHSGISEQARSYRCIPKTVQMRPQNFVYESFFRLTFNMDKKPSHVATPCSTRPAAKLGFFP